MPLLPARAAAGRAAPQPALGRLLLRLLAWLRVLPAWGPAQGPWLLEQFVRTRLGWPPAAAAGRCPMLRTVQARCGLPGRARCRRREEGLSAGWGAWPALTGSSASPAVAGNSWAGRWRSEGPAWDAVTPGARPSGLQRAHRRVHCHTNPSSGLPVTAGSPGRACCRCRPRARPVASRPALPPPPTASATSQQSLPGPAHPAATQRVPCPERRCSSRGRRPAQRP